MFRHDIPQIVHNVPFHSEFVRVQANGRKFRKIDLVLIKLYTNGSAHGLVIGTWCSTLPFLHALKVEANAAYHTKILHDVYVTSWSKLCTWLKCIVQSRVFLYEWCHNNINTFILRSLRICYVASHYLVPNAQRMMMPSQKA
jgi:hypothetical protein